MGIAYGALNSISRHKHDPGMNRMGRIFSGVHMIRHLRLCKMERKVRRCSKSSIEESCNDIFSRCQIRSSLF